MGATAKITISLDAELLEAIERLRRERGQTRSGFIRYAVEQVLRREQEDSERYIRGYQEQSETDEEMIIARQIGWLWHAFRAASLPQRASSTRLRSRSSFARPNIWRFNSLSRLMWPSVGPLL